MSISVSIQDGNLSKEKLKASKSVDQINLGDIKTRLYSLRNFIQEDAINNYIRDKVSIQRDKTTGTILVEINSDMVKKHLGTDKIKFDNESQLKEFLDEFRGIAQIDIKKDRTIDQTTHSTRQELSSLKDNIEMPANSSKYLKLLVKDYNGKLNYDDYMVEHLSDTEFAYYAKRLFAAGAVLDGNHLRFDGNTYYVFKQNITKFNRVLGGKSFSGSGVSRKSRTGETTGGHGEDTEQSEQAEGSTKKGKEEQSSKPLVVQNIQVLHSFNKKANELVIEGKKIALSQLDDKKFLDFFTQTMENNPLDLKKKFSELDEIRKSAILPLQREFFVRMIKNPNFGENEIRAIGLDPKEYKRKIVFDALLQDIDFLNSFKKYHAQASKSKIEIDWAKDTTPNQKICLASLGMAAKENGLNSKQFIAMIESLGVNEFAAQLEENTKLTVKSIWENLKEGGMPEAMVNALKSAGPIGMAFAAVFVLFKVIQKGGWFGLAAISALGIGDAMNGFDLAKSGFSLMSGLMEGGIDNLEGALSGKKKDEVKESAKLTLDKLDESFGYTSFFSLVFGDMKIGDISKKSKDGKLSQQSALEMIKEKGIGEGDYRYGILSAFNSQNFDRFISGATQALGLNLSDNQSEQSVFDYVRDHNNIRRQLLMKGISAKPDKKTEFGQYIQAHKTENIDKIAQGVIAAGIVNQGVSPLDGTGAQAAAGLANAPAQAPAQGGNPAGAAGPTGPESVDRMRQGYPRMIFSKNQYRLIGPDGKEQAFTFGMPTRYNQIEVSTKYGGEAQKIKDNFYILEVIFDIWAGVAMNKRSIQNELQVMFEHLNKLEKDIANGENNPMDKMNQILKDMLEKDSKAAWVGGAIGSSDMANVQKIAFDTGKSMDQRLVAIFNFMRSQWGSIIGSGNSAGVRDKLADEILRDANYTDFVKIKNLDDKIQKELILSAVGQNVGSDATSVSYLFKNLKTDSLVDMGVSREVANTAMEMYNKATHRDSDKEAAWKKANETRKSSGQSDIDYDVFLALGALQQVGYMMKHAMITDVIDKRDDRGDESTKIGLYANMAGLAKKSGSDWRVFSDENWGSAVDWSINIATSMGGGFGLLRAGTSFALRSGLAGFAARTGSKAIGAVGLGSRTATISSWAARSAGEGFLFYQGSVAASAALHGIRGEKTWGEYKDDATNIHEIGRAMAIQGAMLGIGRMLNKVSIGYSDKIPNFLTKDIVTKVWHSMVEAAGMTGTSMGFDLLFGEYHGLSAGEFAEAFFMAFIFKQKFPGFRGKLRVSRGETGEIILNPEVAELGGELAVLESQKSQIIKATSRKTYKETRQDILDEIAAKGGGNNAKRINSGNIAEIVAKRTMLEGYKNSVKEKMAELDAIEQNKRDIIANRGSISPEALSQFEVAAREVHLELAGIASKIDVVSNRLAIEGKLIDYNKKKAELDQKVAELESKNKEQKSKKQDIKGKQDRAADLYNKIKIKEGELTKLSNDYTAQDARVNILKTELNNIKRDVTRIESDIGSIKIEINIIEGNITFLRTQLLTDPMAQSTITVEERSLIVKKQELLKKEKELSTEKQKETKKESEYNAEEVVLSKIWLDIQTIGSEIQAMTIEMQTSSTDSLSLRSERAQLLTEMRQLARERRALDNELINLNGDLQTLNQGFERISDGIRYLDHLVSGSGDPLLRYRYQQEVSHNITRRYTSIDQLKVIFDTAKVSTIYTDIAALPDGAHKDFKVKIPSGEEISYTIKKKTLNEYEIIVDGKSHKMVLDVGKEVENLQNHLIDRVVADAVELRRLWSDTNIMEKYVDDVKSKIESLEDGKFEDYGDFIIQKNGKKYELQIGTTKHPFNLNELASVLKKRLEPHNIYKSFEEMALKRVKEVIVPKKEFLLGDNTYRIIEDPVTKQRTIEAKQRDGSWKQEAANDTQILDFVQRNQHFFMENVVNGIDATIKPLFPQKMSSLIPNRSKTAGKKFVDMTVGDFYQSWKKTLINRPTGQSYFKGLIKDVSYTLFTGRHPDLWPKSGYQWVFRLIAMGSVGHGLYNNYNEGDVVGGIGDYLMVTGPNAIVGTLLYSAKELGLMSDILDYAKEKFK